MGWFDFWRKPSPPSKPVFEGGHCDFARGDKVVALTSLTNLGGKITKGAAYIVQDVSVGSPWNDDAISRVLILLAEAEAFWIVPDTGKQGYWYHGHFRKATEARISDEFREAILTLVPLKVEA